jgi:hypothetical protein
MWRATFFFQVESFTWTESHYLPAGGSVASVTATMQALAILRCNMLAGNAIISAIRIENLTPPRTIYFLAAGSFQARGQLTITGITGNPDLDSAPPWAAVKVRVQGSAGYSTTIYVSGVPEGTIGTGFGSNQSLEGGTPFFNALQAYLAGLVAATVSFRVRQLVDPLVPVQTVSQPAEARGNIAISTNVPLVFGVPPSFGPTRNALVLKGFRRANQRQKGLTGIYLVAAASPALQSGAAAPFIYYLQNTADYSPANQIIVGGASGLVFYYDTFSILNPRGATHRKRGASALAPRGRSRSRA